MAMSSRTRRLYSILSRSPTMAPKLKSFHANANANTIAIAIAAANSRLSGGRYEVLDSYLQSSEIKSYAQLAVNHHNQNDNNKIQLVEVVKGYGETVDGKNYYLTLKANDEQGVTKLFQAKVWVNPFNLDGTTHVTCVQFMPFTDDSWAAPASHRSQPVYCAGSQVEDYGPNETSELRVESYFT